MLEPAKRVDEIGITEFADQRKILPECPVRPPVLLGGDVPTEGIVEIENEVVILPGTTVQLQPGASILIYKRLIAEGTEEHPIHFVLADGAEGAWGTIALKGLACSGSRFKHCLFSGGSGYKDPHGLFEYSSMLSLHDAGKVQLVNCTFRDNHVVDDMVHAVYSDVIFQDCHFYGSKFDALDLDLCKARIDRCTFTGSGNDALDLMTSQVVVTGSQLMGSGDKGISVGENSQCLVLNSVFRKNAIGLLAKDASTALLCHVQLEENELVV